MARLYNLDYLRGLAAFGIMIYHYLGWTTGNFDSQSTLGRFGAYGVAIFYILSGLTLYHVYYDKIYPTLMELYQFFKKRILRIFPLLWLATILTILVGDRLPNLYKVALNLTGLFGIIKWNYYIATGAWSIGNELVFYLFFPAFIFLSKKYRLLFFALAFVILCFYLYFAFSVLDNSQPLAKQWKHYVNPLNQVLLFLGGFFIGMLFARANIKAIYSVLCVTVGFSLFVFYPVDGDQINLVVGVNRIVFTVSMILICFGFYKLRTELPKYLHQPLTLLGEVSYSVYLLHPIIYRVVSKISARFYPLPALLNVMIGISLTLLISYFVYEYFEKFFMKLGRRKRNHTINQTVGV